MPAAAVIPAPRAYTNVVAVKKPVVELRAEVALWPFRVVDCQFHDCQAARPG